MENNLTEPIDARDKKNVTYFYGAARNTARNSLIKQPSHCATTTSRIKQYGVKKHLLPYLTNSLRWTLASPSTCLQI